MKKQLSVHAKLNDGVQSSRIEVHSFRLGFRQGLISYNFLCIPRDYIKSNRPQYIENHNFLNMFEKTVKEIAV